MERAKVAGQRGGIGSGVLDATLASHAMLIAVSHTAEQLQAFVARCEQFRGAEAPERYPDSLALCFVDSVQSTGVKYPSVEKVVARYRV